MYASLNVDRFCICDTVYLFPFISALLVLSAVIYRIRLRLAFTHLEVFILSAVYVVWGFFLNH